jgi:hypothetical protein
MKPGALRKLRYLDTTAAMLESHGKRIADRANTELGESDDVEPGFQMSSRAGARRPFGRHRVSVAAVSNHAKRADRKRNILLRSLG